MRDKWKLRVNWSDGVFNSLERFVDTSSDKQINKFVETKNVDVLFSGRRPEPMPSQKHIEYMLEYAKTKYY